MKVNRKDKTGLIFSSSLVLVFGIILATLVFAIIRENFDIRSKATTRLSSTNVYPFGKAFTLSSNSNLRLKVGTALNVPTLTIEGWFKAGNPSSPGYLFNKRYPLSDTPVDYRSTFDVKLGIFETGTKLNATVMVTGAYMTSLDTNSTPLSDGNWHHIAFVHKQSGNPCMKLFIDGTLVGSGFGCGTLMDAGGDFLIGTKIDSCTAYGCFHLSFNQLQVDEVRVSKIDRYLGNFTVMREPYFPDANTLALLHFDGNMKDASNHFPDAINSAGIYSDSTVYVNPTPTSTLTPTQTPIPQPTQSIDLVTGWNWITLKNTPTNSELTSVLNSITGKYDKVLSEQTVYASWVLPQFNTLKNMTSGSMYMIHMITPATLTLSGIQIPVNQPISIHKGWNWIGYYGNSPLSIEIALASIAGTYQRVLSQDLYYDPSIPDFSSLHTLDPNQGYLLYSNSDQTLVYPTNETGSAQKEPLRITSNSHCSKIITNQYINLYGTFSGKSTRMKTRYLAKLLTPSNSIVGCGTLENGKISILRAFGQETINGKTYPGFQDGESIRLEIIDPDSNKSLGVYTTNAFYKIDDQLHKFSINTSIPIPSVTSIVPTTPLCTTPPACLYNTRNPCMISAPPGGWCLN